MYLFRENGRILFYFGMLWSVGFTLIGCGSASLPSESGTSGYVSQTNDRWTNRSIPVCFTQTNSILSSAKAIIKSGLQAEYGSLGFNFTGFGTCTSSTRALRVVFNNNPGSRVDRIGSSVTTVYLGVDGASHGCSSRVDYLSSNCLRNTVIHEFGHALGLHHEMNRRDDYGRCNQDQTDGYGEDAAINLGDFDEHSLMNYCHLFEQNSANTLTHLSQGDVNTLNTIYSGPVASFDQLPPAAVSSLSSISFRGIGTNVSKFAVKFGSFDSIDCTNPTGYSNFLSVGTTISGAALVNAFLGNGATVAGGDYKICLIGRSTSQTQNYASYSSINVSVQ